MKKALFIGLLCSAAVFSYGCGRESAETEKDTSAEKQEEVTPSEKETSGKEASEKETAAGGQAKEEITVEELKIQNGENTVYGKIYMPEGEGKHPAVILSHGFNGTNSDFVAECRLFAENGYVAYAYDFCGGSARSKSTGATADMTVFTEKSDLLAVFNYISAMEQVDASQMFLFGGSQGGLVTSLVTEELSDRVKGMVLYYPALCIPDDWRKNYPDTANVPETFDFWGLKLGREFVVSIHDFQVFDTIGKYEKDVLILHGDKDNIVPLSYSERAVKLYKNAELITMKGEGHGFTPNAAKTAREKVLEFLKEHTENE